MWDGHKFFVVSEQIFGGNECGSLLMATSSLLSQSRHLEVRSVGWSQVLCCLRASIQRYGMLEGHKFSVVSEKISGGN